MPLSRRSLLTAGGAFLGLGTAAAVGVETEVLPGRARVYRTLGINGDAGTVPDVEGGGVISDTFTSKARGTDVGWALARPPGAHESLPVVVVLHGRGADHRAAFDPGYMALDRFLADAVAKGVPPFAIASVDGGDTYWHDRRSGDKAATMVVDELLPLLTGKGLDTGRLGFLGWSMGGYGALRFGLQLGPRRVRAVGALSPAIWHRYPDSAPGAFDDEADFDAGSLWDRQGDLDGIQVRIDCGESDPFYEATKDYRQGFATKPAGGFSLGAHDEAYWRRMVPANLAMLGRALNA